MKDIPQKPYDQLKKRIEILTFELTKATANLKEEVAKRKEAEEGLRKTISKMNQLENQLQKEEICIHKKNLDDLDYEIIGQSKGIKQVLNLVEQVAKTDSTVLLIGETGTGKELVAEAIHIRSNRKNRSMVKVNCAALPTAIVESEIFGREKGAYTGALNKQIGRFELADQSTLLLDEITELPLEVQSKLLRVIQTGEFERLGSSKTLHVNVRVLTATNRDIVKAVEIGKFRDDLYYRLNVFPILIPPLRDRSEDIPQLVWKFVKEFNISMGKRIESISRRSMESMRVYSWPGNIRELRNVIERSMILCEGRILEVQVPRISDSILYQTQTLADIERGYIIKVLEKTRGRIYGTKGAAAILGLRPTTLYSRMSRLGVIRPSNYIIIASIFRCISYCLSS